MLSIATLGPAGSNHELVVRRYLDYLAIADAQVALTSDFAAAVELLRRERVDCVVQCAAHPAVAETIGANRSWLFVVDTFIAPGRALGVLTRSEIESPVSIAFHPATRSYVDLGRWRHHVEEQSTVAVAQGLLAGKYDSGIAALEAASANPDRLRVDETIGAVDDAWLVYARRRVCEHGMVAWRHGPGARWLRDRARDRAAPGGAAALEGRGDVE